MRQSAIVFPVPRPKGEPTSPILVRMPDDLVEPLKQRAREVLAVVKAAVPADFCVIAVGGVETADDVQQLLDAGATLVQGYTAFLYRGPLWARQINRGLRQC